jgi:hypothetical protein
MLLKLFKSYLNYVGKNCNSYKILVGDLEGKSTLGRPRRRREGNIRVDHSETGLKDVDWIHLVQDSGLWRDFVSTVMNLRIP